MRKPILKISMALALLTLLIAPTQAAIISISNLTDGIPIVNTDLTGKTITTAFEEALITGALLIGTVPPIAVGTRSVILLEPTIDPFGPRVSDFATLTVGEVQQGPAGVFQVITLFFQSDGAAGFDRNVAALPANTPQIPETGDFQDVSSLLGSSPLLQIQLASDLATSEPAEPGSWMLLITGLGAAVAFRRMKKSL